MKRIKIKWTNILVVFGIFIPEAIFFWSAHTNFGNIFLFAGLVFLWNFGLLAGRFFLVRFIFDKKDHFGEHLLVMFLTSNYLFFGFASWVFVDTSSLVYTILPFFVLMLYMIVWLSQSAIAWEYFTFVSLAFSIFFAWQLSISLAFPGGIFALLVLYNVFICAYNWAKTHKLPPKSALFFSFILSLILSEVGWVMLLWPIDLLSLSLVMIGIFYIFGSLALHTHKNTLRKHHVIRYLSGGLVYFVLLGVSTEWKLPF